MNQKRKMEYEFLPPLAVVHFIPVARFVYRKGEMKQSENLCWKEDNE